MRLPAAVALAALALVAPPAAAQSGERLPRLWLSARVLDPGDKLVIRGTDCEYTGLGNGYGAALFNGDTKGPDSYPEPDAQGRWEAYHLMAGVPAGRYVLKATCFRAMYPNDPYYPHRTSCCGRATRSRTARSRCRPRRPSRGNG